VAPSGQKRLREVRGGFERPEAAPSGQRRLRAVRSGCERSEAAEDAVAEDHELERDAGRGRLLPVRVE
jgi:hypothetical protein